MPPSVHAPGAGAASSPSGGGDGASFWSGKLPKYLRLGGLILGALLGGRGRREGAVAAAFAGAILVGAAVHVGLGLVRQGALSAEGWDKSKVNVDDLAPSWTDYVPQDLAQNVKERFGDWAARAREIFDDGDTAYTRTVHTAADFERQFPSRDGEAVARAVPTSGLLAVGRLEGFEGASFDNLSIRKIEKSGLDDSQVLAVKWTGAEEGKTYPATIQIKKGEETVSLRVNLTCTRVGPLGAAVELELAERYIRRHTDSAATYLRSLGDDVTPDDMRAARENAARAVKTAAEMLDPNHPLRQDMKAMATQLEHGVFATPELESTLEALFRVGAHSSSPRSLNLLGGDAGEAERKILERVLSIPQLNAMDLKAPIAPLAPEKALEVLQAVAYQVPKGHPMATLAEHLTVALKGSNERQAAAALTDLRDAAAQRYGFLMDPEPTTPA